MSIFDLPCHKWKCGNALRVHRHARCGLPVAALAMAFGRMAMRARGPRALGGGGALPRVVHCGAVACCVPLLSMVKCGDLSRVLWSRPLLFDMTSGCLPASLPPFLVHPHAGQERCKEMLSLW